MRLTTFFRVSISFSSSALETHLDSLPSTASTMSLLMSVNFFCREMTWAFTSLSKVADVSDISPNLVLTCRAKASNLSWCPPPMSTECFTVFLSAAFASSIWRR